MLRGQEGEILIDFEEAQCCCSPVEMKAHFIGSLGTLYFCAAMS